jgi:hypothetical protein
MIVLALHRSMVFGSLQPWFGGVLLHRMVLLGCAPTPGSVGENTGDLLIQ